MNWARVLVFAVSAAMTFSCRSKVKREDPTTVPLSESYTVASKLAVVHFPAVFAASQPGDKVALIAPLAPSGYDDAIEVHVGTNDRPITNLPAEYARILHKPLMESHPDWAEEARRPATCLKGFLGIETTATFTGRKGKKLRYRSCTFLTGGHGYWLAYMGPETTFVEDEPLLRRIIDATEINP